MEREPVAALLLCGLLAAGGLNDPKYGVQSLADKAVELTEALEASLVARKKPDTDSKKK